MKMKRCFDILVSGIGLFLLFPLFVTMAIAIRVESSGPIFFRQERVGLNGKIFRIRKFRTMVFDAEKRGLQITVGDDCRITKVGTLLRKSKLDELAQLLDVIVGDMSLVGPRPEVPYYVNYYSEKEKELIFSVRPGITDWASIQFKDENTILAKASDPQATYINEILPIKVRYYTEYVNTRSFFGDIKIIYLTILKIFFR